MSILEKRQKKIAKLAEGKILDIGYACQPNPFLLNGTIGIDLVRCKTPKNYKKTLIGNAMEIDSFFPKNYFDTIIGAEIIEHLENPAKFLRAARKILKPDGKLILSACNPYHLPTIFANAFLIRPVFTAHVLAHDPWHISIFPFRSMVTLLEHCDFTLTKTLNANGLILNPDISKGPIFPFFKSFSQSIIYIAEKADVD